MNFKQIPLILCTLLIYSATQAQNADSVSLWKSGGNFNLNFSQVTLSNWAAGGQSSIAVGGLFNTFANRETSNGIWENRMEMAFGGVRQSNVGEFRKTDDYIILVSKYGQKFNEKFLISGLMDFRTQMASGFTYAPDINNVEVATEVSKFMAPGYLILSIGITYKKGDVFTATLSPLTSKMTFVMDDSLAAYGAYGVDLGKQFRFQGGANLTMSFKKTLMENVTFASNANFFADYKSMKTVDINWDALFLFKINKYLTSSIGAQAIYDQDVKSKEVTNTDGTKRMTAGTQFKSAIQVGLALTF